MDPGLTLHYTSYRHCINAKSSTKKLFSHQSLSSYGNKIYVQSFDGVNQLHLLFSIKTLQFSVGKMDHRHLANLDKQFIRRDKNQLSSLGEGHQPTANCLERTSTSRHPDDRHSKHLISKRWQRILQWRNPSVSTFSSTATKVRYEPYRECNLNTSVKKSYSGNPKQ